MMNASLQQILRRHMSPTGLLRGFSTAAHHATATLSSTTHYVTKSAFPSSSPIRLDVSSIQQSARTYHSTSTANLPERRIRRRRGGVTGGVMTDDSSGTRKNDNDEEGANEPDGAFHHTPVTDLAKFQEAAETILKKLYDAVQPMKAVNDTFAVTLGHDHVVVVENNDSENEVAVMNGILTIALDPASGTYIIESDALSYSLTMHSPVSGAHTYVLSQRTGDWVGIEDGHNFEGLFVRDIIRQCKGVPNL